MRAETKPPRDVRRFFATGEHATSDADRRCLLAEYGAAWVIVEKKKPAPQDFLSSLEHVYEDKRFVLYRVPSAARL